MILSVVAVACGGLLVGVSVLGNRAPERDVALLYERVLPASVALNEAADQHALSDTSFLTALSGPAEQRAVSITNAQSAGNRASSAWSRYRKQAFGSPAERRLQRRYARSVRVGTSAGAVAYGLVDAPDRVAYAAALTLVHDASVQTRTAIRAIDKQFYNARRANDLNHAQDSLASVRTWTLLAFAIVLVLGLLIALVLLRGAFRAERESDQQDEERRVEQDRSDLENQLQRGLEMEPTEETTYGVIRKALARVGPVEPAEVLIADSSYAHFRQVVSTDADGLPACAVSSPGECPAASSGQTRVFPSSERLDACPYLASRDGGPRSAVCVPISIAGTNSGMIHTTAPDQAPLPPEKVIELELVARKAGDRIGFLRVLARTETQARVDPLTGLLNRRSLEDQSGPIRKAGEAFVVAFADLDHFKDLNDKHGHEIGDRALRLFARVLRDSIRPADIAARYGGEEFVILLPECTLVDARIVANRVRERLAIAVAGATVPPFTVSIGLAAWEDPEGIDDTVARADAALLAAKSAGRDRVLTSATLPPMPDPDAGKPAAPIAV